MAIRRMRKAIFLDKDGTIITNVPYNINQKFVSIEKETISGLKFLQAMGFSLIIVTNQSSIEKGIFSQEDFFDHISYIKKNFLQHGIFFSGVYFCPHNDTSFCYCRKPNIGMFDQAMKELCLDKGRSWMIGDILNDIEAGNSFGVRSILVNTGNETDWDISKNRTPFLIVGNILQAALEIAVLDKIPRTL